MPASPRHPGSLRGNGVSSPKVGTQQQRVRQLFPHRSSSTWRMAQRVRAVGVAQMHQEPESIWHEHADSLSDQVSPCGLKFIFKLNICCQVDPSTQARILSKAGLVMSSAPISRSAADEIVRNPQAGGKSGPKSFNEFMDEFQRCARAHQSHLEFLPASP